MEIMNIIIDKNVNKTVVTNVQVCKVNVTKVKSPFFISFVLHFLCADLFEVTE